MRNTEDILVSEIKQFLPAIEYILMEKNKFSHTDSLLDIKTKINAITDKTTIREMNILKNDIQRAICAKNIVDAAQVTPLIKAIDERETKVATLLLQAGVDINACDHLKNTPLYVAIARKNRDLVEKLIDKGAELNADNLRGGHTPLTYAVYVGANDVIELLIKNGADINKCNKNHNTPLIQAAMATTAITNELPIIIKRLIDAGADVNAVTSNKETPLFLAVDKNDLEMVSLLIEEKADVNLTNFQGKSPLYLAVFKEDQGIAKLLLNAGAQLNSVDNENYKALSPEGKKAFDETLASAKKARNSITPQYNASKSQTQTQQTHTADSATPKLK